MRQQIDLEAPIRELPNAELFGVHEPTETQPECVPVF